MPAQQTAQILHLAPRGTRPLLGAAMWPMPGDTLHLGLVMPCQGEYSLSNTSANEKFVCLEQNRRHTHLVIEDYADGVGIVPAAIFSRPFLNTIFDDLSRKKMVSRPELELLLKYEQVRIINLLLPEMTNREYRISLSPRLREEAIRCFVNW